MSERKISGPSVFEEDGGCCGNLECLGSDLVLQIFANLQLTDLLKLRRVCKSWYDAIFSSEFSQLWKHGEEEVWVLLSFRSRCSALRESYREIWCPNSSSFRPKKIPSTGYIGAGFGANGFEALCSSHGLVCGRKDYGSKYVLAVGNPITNRWKQLPPVNLKPDKYYRDRNRFFMERDPDSGCYTVVILVRGATGFNYAWQYESKLETWQKVGLENIRSYGTPTGYMLLLYPLEFFELFDPFAMPQHEHEHEAWQTLCTNMRHDPNVVHEHEKLYGKDTHLLPLASLNYKGKHILITFSVQPHRHTRLVVGVGLWELDEKNLGWKLISTNRGVRHSELQDDLSSWKCQLVGDMIIVSPAYLYPFTWHNGFLPIAYDLLHSTWTTLSYPCVSRELQDDAVLCYGFIPSLKAQI